jgi:hypothetical protein
MRLGKLAVTAQNGINPIKVKMPSFEFAFPLIEPRVVALRFPSSAVFIGVMPDV